MPFLGKQPNAGFATIVKDSFTPNGSTTAFTLSKNVLSANDIAVFVGNVRQEPTTAYTVSGTSLTMSAAPASGVNFYVLHIAGAHESSVVPKSGSVVPGDFGSERMGIGGQAFSGNEKLLIDTTDSATLAKIKTTAGGLNVDLEDGSATSRIRHVGTILDFGADFNNTGVSDPRIRFRVGNTPQCSINSHGGIAFGNDTAAANTLNDYEEGTWNPFSGRSSAFTGEFTRNAMYTKIGNLIHIDVRMQWTGTDNSSNAATFLLPYSSATANGSTSPASAYQAVAFYEGGALLGGPISAHISSGTDEFAFYGASGGSFASVSRANFNGNYDVVLSLTYFTA